MDDPRSTWRPSGFFVLRTPLLTLSDLQQLSHRSRSATLETTSKQEWRAALESARTSLRLTISRLVVRRALLTATPLVDSAIDYWVLDPDSKRGLQAERTLVKYFARMCARSTPFGLFSGFSVGTVACSASDDRSFELELVARERYRPKTFFDFATLEAFADTLSRDPAIKRELSFFPNSTLHSSVSSFEYLEQAKGPDTLRLTALAKDRFLANVIERARSGAKFSELVESLRCVLGPAKVNDGQVEAYLDELISNAVLVSELRPPLTGAEPAAGLLAKLEEIPACREWTKTFLRMIQMLAEVDSKRLGTPLSEIRDAAVTTLTAFGITPPADPSKLFYVELNKPFQSGHLPSIVVKELNSAAQVLLRLAPKHFHGEAQLEGFRTAFRERYGDAWIPLSEALSEETGVGFPADAPSGSSVLLREILPPTAEGDKQDPLDQTDLRRLLLRKLMDWSRDRQDELILEERDIPEMSSVSRKRPNSFCMNATLIATSADAVNRGDFRVLVRYITGPSGVMQFGRLCHSENHLRQHVQNHIIEEDHTDAESLYAEVIYAPEGRSANLACRPIFRPYEIVYGGASGTSEGHRIPASELLVNVAGDKIVLFWPRLQRRVLPRKTNSHNHLQPHLPPVYRFLCALQWQEGLGIPPLQWGALDQCDYLPRVTVGRSVVSLARWRLQPGQISELRATDRYTDFLTIQRWRHDLKWPQWVSLDDDDNALPVDLDNPLSVDTLAHLLRRGGTSVIREFYPAPGHSAAQVQKGTIVTRCSCRS